METCLRWASQFFKHPAVTYGRGDRDQIPSAAPKMPRDLPSPLCPPSNPRELHQVGSAPTGMGCARLYLLLPLHRIQDGTKLQETATLAPKILQLSGIHISRARIPSPLWNSWLPRAPAAPAFSSLREFAENQALT